MKLFQSTLSKQLSPIVVFAYRRLDHLQATIEALKKNLLSNESDLIIYSDGAKSESDQILVNTLRNYIAGITGFKTLTIRCRATNFGLSKSIIDGVGKVIDDYGKAIILEDDMVTSPYFLRYMNEALTCFDKNPRVISIHGYVYPASIKLPEAFFLRGADCWGWGTWKRGWDSFNPNGRLLLRDLRSRGLVREFDFDGAYPFTKMLEDQIAGRNDSWAILWHASAFLANKLTLYPGNSLVANIGNDSSGTHCETSSQYDVQLSANPIDLNGLAVAESKEGRDAFKVFFLANKRSILQRLANKFSSLLGRK